MRSIRKLAFTLIVVPLAGLATAASAQGPMSSGKPPETQAGAPSAATANAGDFDVEKLFASTCGWCHSDGGRAPGKGPKLMGTTLSDAEIIYRIKNGKTGAMPAFGSTFNDAQLQAIVRYIRSLHE